MHKYITNNSITMNSSNKISQNDALVHSKENISLSGKYKQLIGGLIIAISSTVWAQGRVVEIPKMSDFVLWDTCTYVRNDNRGGNVELSKTIRTVVQWKDGLEFSNGSTNRPIEQDYIGIPEANGTWRKWPLQVWETWEYKEDKKRADGVMVNITQKASVIWEEEVITPAGKFQTFKIVYDGWYRTGNGGNGRQLDTYWYSPEARANVKWIRDDKYNMFTQQLIECKKWDSK